MKKLNEFDVNIYSLQNQTYHFNYKITDEFFTLFDFAIVDNGNFDVSVELTRSERLIEVVFHIKGIIKMECDKSLEPFDFKIDSRDKTIYKFAEEYEEISEELIHIPSDYPRLNFAQNIYEFISVAIPMRRIHPDLEMEEEDFDENEDDLTFVYSSLDEEEDDLLDDSEEHESDDDDDDRPIDPRWDTLKKLK